MNPKISVLLPVYNNQETIYRAAQSILNQTFSDFELIILNDGSTDETSKILDKLKDDRIIRIDSKENMGLPRRLNQGIRLAKGKYIARMDADDVSFPDRFQKQIEFLEANKTIDLLGTRAAVIDKKGELLGLLPFFSSHKDLITRKWQGIQLPHPTWMMRQEWANKHMYKIPEVWRAEDQELLLRASLDSKYACLPDILLCYYYDGFNFKKSFAARRSLAVAQMKYFVSSHDLSSFFKTIIIAFIRVCTDALQFAGATKFIKSYKWSEKISQVEIDRIYKVWNSEK